MEPFVEVVPLQNFDVSLNDLDPKDLDWLTPGFDFADVWTAPVGEDDLYPSAGFDVPQSETLMMLPEQASMSFEMSVPGTMEDSRSLVPRASATANNQRTANLIFSTFKSYLLMFQQDTLPPFIHPSILHSALTDNQLEPLMTCINLVQMTGKNLRGSRQLFWRNVRLECERWHADVRTRCS